MRLTITLAVVLAVAGCQPVTRGEVRDREAALDVERCANQYLGKPNSGPETEIWIMCLHVSSELAGRDKVRVAERVLAQRGNVFEPDRPSTLTPSLIERIRRGE